MSTGPSPTHYEVLGIGPQASAEEVDKAYRFTLELYGDGALATYSLLDPDEVRRARTRVQEAYDVLRDPQRRHDYDVSQGLAEPGSRPPPRPEPPPVADNVRAWPTPVARPAPPDPVPLVPAPAFAPMPAAPAPPLIPAHPRTPQVLAEPVTGSVLRRFREERGISLRDIANQSKIGTRYLEYIEGDRHDMLPAPVYLRGFLQEYARALGLDPRRTANAYMSQFPRPWPQD